MIFLSVSEKTREIGEKSVVLFAVASFFRVTGPTHLEVSASNVKIDVISILGGYISLDLLLYMLGLYFFVIYLKNILEEAGKEDISGIDAMVKAWSQQTDDKFVLLSPEQRAAILAGRNRASRLIYSANLIGAGTNFVLPICVAIAASILFIS